MEDLVDLIFDVELNEIHKIEFPKNKRFGLIITLNNVKYEFIINLKEKSDKLITLGAGALGFDSKHDRTKPYFNRWSWDFNESTICYNDPTMYLDNNLRGGWGVGDINEFYLENIAGLILILADCFEIKCQNILHFGSSAGGFMSIILATLIKGSTALADIPQLNLKDYYEWEDLKKYCFNGLSEDIIIKNFYHRFSVIEMIKHENYIPNAILVFDCSVTPDITMQYAPFVTDLNQIPYRYNKNNLKILINGKNIGHAPLNKPDSLKLVQNIIKTNLINETEITNFFIESNNYLKNKVLNSYHSFNLRNFSFLLPRKFIEKKIASENTIKIIEENNNDFLLFISIFERDGNYCEENFENMLKNISNDDSLKLIKSNKDIFKNYLIYNLIYQNKNKYESCYFIIKNNKTFRITFNLGNEFENKSNKASTILKLILESLICKEYSLE